MKGMKLSFLALILAFLTTSFAHAQLATADILGTVTDNTGAVIPNAKVTLTDTGTNVSRTATTNGSGDYVFNLLNPSTYKIKVEAPGFKSFTTTSAVEAGDRARTDAHLSLGESSETVNVEATTPLLQADNATVSSTVTAKSVQDLPLNGRNFINLVQLVPGANAGPGNGLTSGGRPDDRRATSGFSVNGQDNTLNNFIIDGIDDNERVIGTIGVKPSVEGIQEITVQTNSYTPEVGRTAGGVVNIITRSGTNQIHGTVYEFFRNDIFDANPFFTPQGQRKAELRQNQYGASLGGPIIKNRTFFFGDYEGLRIVAGTNYSSTVPTLAQYNEINSIGGASPQQLLASGNGTANQTIDPVALNYLKLFPAPNSGGPDAISNNYVVNPNKVQTSNTYDARIDHTFNPSNLFFARFAYNGVNTVTPQALGTAPNGIQVSGGRYIFAGPAKDTAQQWALSYTHIFSPSLLLDLKAAYTRVNNFSAPLNYGTSPDTTVGFGANMNFNSFSNFLTPVGIGPFSDIGDGAYVPLQDIDNTFLYSGTVTYTKGNHNIRFGASFIRRQARNVQSAFAAGQYGFGLTTDTCAPGTKIGANGCNTPGTAAQVQNNNLASTLTGAFTFVNRQYDLFPPDYRSYEPSAFAQDSWRVTSKLTVIYGGRYDLFTPFTEAHGHISNFDFTQALGLTPQTVASALKVPGVNGVGGHAGIQTDYSNFAPRVGFAYSANSTTVIRGGYGLSFYPNNYTSNADLKNAPFVSVYNPNCISSVAYNIERSQGQSTSGINPDCAAVGANSTFDSGTPLPVAQTINSPSLSLNTENPNFKSALVQQFNLQVERQIGANVLTIGYVGNIGQHLAEPINDINQAHPGDPTAPNASPNVSARPLGAILPNLSSVGYLNTEGISNYNGLQTSFQRRFTKGLAFDINYTWAKAMSDTVGFSEEGQQGYSNADPNHIRQIEYGPAENDIRNRFALSGDYAEQYGKEFTGVKRFALTGWETNVIWVWQSGRNFSIVNSGNGPGGFGNRATPVNNGGQDRPNQIHSANLSHKTLQEFFDVTAFQAQPLGTIGNAQRNSLQGPHFRDADVSIFKDFPVTQRLAIQFRAESFNISNTPNFYINNNSGNGETQIGNTQFGQINNTDPNYNPRQLQFALKAIF